MIITLGGISVDAEWFNLIGDAKVNYSLKNKDQANSLKGSTLSYNYDCGIDIHEDNCSVSGVNIVNNKGLTGGGCYLNGEDISISNCNIVGNLSMYNGGGIQVINDDISISNCCIMYNSSEYEHGGGVFVFEYCDVILSGLIYI